MITGQITRQAYEQKLNSLSPEQIIKVATLDGSPVVEGFAFLYREVEIYNVFSMYYEGTAGYMQTTIFAAREDGGYSRHVQELDTTVIYHGHTVGNYPDTPEHYQRFVNGQIRRPIEYPAATATCGYPSEFLLTYPGKLFALEFSPPWHDKKYIIAGHFGGNFETDSLQDLQRELFDTFLVLGLSF